GQLACHGRDGIVLLDGASLAGSAMLLDAIMHVGHEIVEMDAPLALRRHKLEEHVHEHGLATADSAMHVKAPDGSLLLPSFCEQPAQRAGFARDQLFAKFTDQPVKPLNDTSLGGVTGDRTAGDHMVVALPDGRMRFKAVAKVHSGRHAGQVSKTPTL